MKKKLMQGLLAATLLFGVSAIRAQEPPPGPPPEGPGGPDGPMGPRMELLGFAEMHPGKLVTGAPYMASAVTETKQTLADGNTIDRKVQSTVYRDSQGRTRRETTFTGAGPLTTSGQPRSIIMIHDPVASTAYVLHPDKKTAEQLPGPRNHANKGSNNMQGKFEARIQEEIANGTLKKDDLGTQTINGIPAQGTRYTRTIPAGQMGNANPILIVTEQWYSPDLQIIVKSTRTDPRFGQTTYALTNIQRTEPASALFTVPSDYSVTQATMRPHGRRMGGPGGPDGAAPPPPPSE